MRALFLQLLLLPLVACASNTPIERRAAHSLIGPAALGAADVEAPSAQNRAGDGTAPKDPMLPVGIGLTSSPSTTLLGAAYDIPADDNLTLGPAILYGFDSDETVFALNAQGKYFLNTIGESLLPYLTAGVGLGHIDRQGRSGDTGLLLSAGAGVRFKTGENYLIGSELQFHYAPSELSGDSSFFSWQVLQFILTF